MAISERDRQFLLLCNEVRKGSHDPDRQVGAVIVDRSGHQIAAGTNAPPHVLRLTLDQSRESIRNNSDWKYFVLEHAERNAIFSAYAESKPLEGGTMYTTLFPCADCARAIVAAKLARLVVLGITYDSERDAKWINHYRHAEQILALAGIMVEIADFGNSIENS